MKKVLLFLILFSVMFPVHLRAQEAGKSDPVEGNTPLGQPAKSDGQRLQNDSTAAANESSGQSKVVVEIPRTQWCQCVRALLNVEGGNIAGCVKSGASEEKLKIFRSRGAGNGSSATVTALLAFAGCTESENENVGSLSFDIQWQGPAVPLPSGAASSSQIQGQPGAPISCAQGGISTVEATLYRSNRAKLAAAGPWKCTNPVKTLHSIPASSNIRLVVTGKNASGTVLYRGEQAGVTITYGKITAIGTIPALPFTPALAAPADEALLPSGRVRFTWAGATGATSYRLQLSENPQFTPVAIERTVSSPSFETGPDLASRTYYWRVMTTDAFNNSSDWSPSRSLAVDAEAPNNTTADTFINKGAAKSYSATVSLAISATKKTGVAAYYISERSKKPSANKAGWVALPSPPSYSAVIPYTMKNGNGVKKIFVWFKDAQGRLSGVKSGSIKVDTSLPRTTISGHPADPTNALTASFGFSSTKPGSAFQCQLDDGAYSACTGTMSYEGLSAGTHTFAVKAIDTGNNAEEKPARFSWTIDTTPPHTALTSQPPVWTNSPAAAFSFSSTKTGSVFQCRLDGAPFTDCISPQDYTGLASGAHTFQVRATDGIGNSDPTPAQYAWTIDTTPFETTITGQPSNPSHSHTAGFSFATKKTGATFQCELDHGSFAECPSPMTYSQLDEGSHTFRVKAVDSIGNEDVLPAEYTWVVTVPPINTTSPDFINRGSAYLVDREEVKLSISATSEKGVTGYFVSESPAPPDATDPGWVKIPAAQEYARNVDYTLSKSGGKRRVYVWFKDDAGNISNVQSASVYKFNPVYLVIVHLLLQVFIILAAG